MLQYFPEAAMTQITCPWCGTNYTEFIPNCKNCGGSLPLPPEKLPPAPAVGLPELLQSILSQPDLAPLRPPMPPRQVPRNYTGRLLGEDAWFIVALVFSILGVVFAPLGIGLMLPLVTAFVGIPFLGMGVLFLGGGIGVLIWRIQTVQRRVAVLKDGETALGEINDVHMNSQVQINGRSPWVFQYTFEVNGQSYNGKLSTLSYPDMRLQAGRPAYILYQKDDPSINLLYPPPYEKYSLQ
jgi:hypothetical protein